MGFSTEPFRNVPAPPPLCDIPSGCCFFTGPWTVTVLPFACCVGSLLSVSRCGRCSCWCRFCVCGAKWLMCWARGGNYNRSRCDPRPSYLSKLAGGGGGGSWGGGVLAAQPGGGAACDPLLPHAYLGPWGYRGMYALIAISRLCQEERVRGLKDQRHSTPFNQAWDKNLAPLVPWPPHRYLSKLGGRGGGGVADKDRARPPPRGAGAVLDVAGCAVCALGRPVVGVLGLCWLFRGSFDCLCCPHTSVLRSSTTCLAGPRRLWTA